jgi:hypothetical protein
MRTEGNEGTELLLFVSLVCFCFQKSAHGGQNWADTNPQESERRTAPGEAFSGGPARLNSEKLWFDPCHATEMRTEGNEGIAPLRLLGLLLFQKSAHGGKIGRAPIRKSLSGGLRQRSRFRAGLRV